MSRLGSVLLSACVGGLGVAVASPACGPTDEAAAELAARAQCEETSSELFERRIAPLLAADRPQSCNGCHLSGIDLGMFVRDSACETVACLVELGLANPDRPERSLVLEWIRRAEPESELITQEVIDEEYEGFHEWLVESLACGEGACARAPCGSPDRETFCELDEELPEESREQLPSCSEAELELLFRDEVFAHRGRCFPCHHEGQESSAPDAPDFFATAGGCNTASLESQRIMLRAGYFDLEQPEQSLLLLKPLDEQDGGVEHGGHAKFRARNDTTYLAFLSYIERLSECSGR